MIRGPALFRSEVTLPAIPRIVTSRMDAFREIYDRHWHSVYRLALFLTGDPREAQDLTADTFVRAWTARDRLRTQTVRAYLLTITRNLYRDQCRRREARFVELDDATPSNGRAPTSSRGTPRACDECAGISRAERSSVANPGSSTEEQS